VVADGSGMKHRVPLSTGNTASSANTASIFKDPDIEDSGNRVLVLCFALGAGRDVFKIAVSQSFQR